MAQTTRQRIVKTAYRLFAKNGYEATSMNLICRKAKISKGALYHYFDSKETLLATVFEDMLIKPALEEVFDAGELNPENLRGFIEQMGLQMIDSVSHDPTQQKFTIQMLGTVANIPGGLKSFKPAIDSTLKRLIKLVDKGVEYNLIPSSADRELLAQQLFMYLDMLGLYACLGIEFRLKDLWINMVRTTFGKEGALC